MRPMKVILSLSLQNLGKYNHGRPYQALQILLKYGNPYSPTHCEHDSMLVCIDPDKVSKEDKEELDRLGFFPSDEDAECFESFRFGSA